MGTIRNSWLCVIGLAAGVVALLSIAPAVAQDASPVAQAYAETDAKFREIKDNVATVKEKLDNVGQQLDLVEDYLKKHPEIAPREQAALRRRLAEVRETLRKSSEVLETFGSYADKVTRAADAVNEVRYLYKAAVSDRLSDKVRVLGNALEKIGRDVPVLGPFIEAYGTAMNTLVDATDKLDKQISETFRQDQIGSAIHGGKSDPRYKKLVEQFGRDFADNTTYAPQTLRHVFRPIDKPLDAALIWDQEAGEWYRVEGNVNVEGIFSDVLKARGKPPTPAQLKHLADNDQHNKARQAVADAFASYLRTASDPRSLSPSSGAFVRLGEESGKVILALRDPAFRAKFTYDGAFRVQMLEALEAMRTDLANQGRPAQRSLRELDALLDQYDTLVISQESLPDVGTVRVVAWFPENPKDKFRSRWKFNNASVSITGTFGRASGTRSGNTVRYEGTANGCTTSEVATFEPGGRLTFSGTYTCKECSSSGTGVGRWEVISVEPQAVGKAPK